ncbi:MAG: HAMP domain-containing protein [Chloroflexi bacterium]|nr:HAMP domain-containing protein [Chloroflexota bacterium]
MFSLHSLTLKIIVGFVAVAILSVVVLSILVNRATSTEFTSYLEHTGRMQGMMGGMMGGGGMGMMDALGEAEQQFLGNLQGSLRWAGLAAVGLGLAIGALLARQIVLPLRQLTLATRQLAAGNRKQRVAISSRDEVGEVSRAFNTMAETLARNEELRRNMIADIAHELRTPLAVLQAELEAMQDGVVEASPAKLAALHEEVTRLSRLVADLRTLSLAEAGQLEFHLAPVDAAEVTRRVAAAFETAAASKHVSLNVKVENQPADSQQPTADTRPPTADSRLQITSSRSKIPPPPGPPAIDHRPPTADSLGRGGGLTTPDSRLTTPFPPVRADADRLAQILRNLLDNALRYTPEGGRIDIKLSPDGAGAVLFSVSDTGPGIPEKDLPHIFERFYRADPSRTHATGGSGIGLTIVKQLVEGMGGKVWATSQPGKGATFFFTLPAP